MKITHKLILGFWFLTVCIWIVSYYSISSSRDALKETIEKHDVALAHALAGEIDHLIFSRLETFQGYSRDVLLRDALAKSNASFAKYDDIQKYIDDVDSQWKLSDRPASSGNIIFNELSENSLSEELKEKKEYYRDKYGYDIYSEVFATNKYGAIAGLTDLTTDYRQDDEEWWLQAKEKGLFIEDLNYDESAEVYTVNFAIRVTDEQGDFLGVLKVALNIEEIIRLMKKTTANENHKILDYSLATKDGRLIYSSAKNYSFLQDVSQKEYYQKASGAKGFFISKGHTYQKDDEFFVYARSTGFREFKGFDWILLIGHEIDEVFASVDDLSKKLYGIVLFATIFAVLVTVLSVKLISRPIVKLRKGVEAIGKGQLGETVDLVSSDEIGELAAAFNTMSKDLNETTVSRDSLFQEIEERKKAEAQIKAAHTELDQIFNTAADGLIVIDMDFNIVRVNRTLCLLFGLRADDVLGKKCHRVFPGPNCDTVQCPLHRILEGEERIEYEEEKTAVDGARLSFIITATPLRNPDGEIIGIVESLKDITPRKKMEKERERLIKELQTALDEVKTLSGIVPICMYCKKIRDDQGYWNQLEKFISEHSDAKFSHSICDKCMEEHYSELGDDNSPEF